ncbi:MULTISPECIES: FAD-dependent oxidoreductase [Actinosynnema]|uniref:FAD-dependent oxidoreductase n=1 Tax=Actinosynnema TaxID=40566 RepID=UPI0020A463C4|nr:FAD-dependent oxidoreductase [Actinosynnema pretiosum]MCP2098018.1 sarcosine oxidase [Actinosynnema pretiosum]
MVDVDVVVVGGGAMGSAATWQLALRGTDVLLLERFVPGHTEGASHGASRIFRLAYADPLYVRLAARALPLWRELGPEVFQETGGVDHGDLTGIQAALTAEGVPATPLDPREATERWPDLRFDGPVLFHPRAGRLNADLTVHTLQSAAKAHGATVHHGEPALRLEHDADGVTVTTGRATYRARQAVVAVGAWTRRLLEPHLPLPPLRVTEEQPAHFATTSANWPSFIHHRGADTVYGLLTPGEGVKAGFHGGGPETDPDHRDRTPEPTRLAALRDYARAWLPGADPDRAAPISCTYTTTPTSDFVLDRAGNLTVAAGFSGHGFKFTPAIGEVLADLVLAGARPNTRFALPVPD